MRNCGMKQDVEEESEYIHWLHENSYQQLMLFHILKQKKKGKLYPTLRMDLMTSLRISTLHTSVSAASLLLDCVFSSEPKTTRVFDPARHETCSYVMSILEVR